MKHNLTSQELSDLRCISEQLNTLMSEFDQLDPGGDTTRRIELETNVLALTRQSSPARHFAHRVLDSLVTASIDDFVQTAGRFFNDVSQATEGANDCGRVVELRHDRDLLHEGLGSVVRSRRIANRFNEFLAEVPSADPA